MKPLVSMLVTALLLVPAAGWSQGDAEALRNAKTLFFDRQYAEARDAWRGVHETGGGRQSATALYWIARCSEKLGESERALAEYAEYLDARPSDRTLREEAKTSRVALAVKLSRAGKTTHREVLLAALHDSSRTVRYFAALQMASLGPELGRPAVPVLQEILKSETDPDLVERAKLALLRLDRSALAEATAARAGSGERTTGWVRVRLWEKGASKPQLSLNFPVFLADMVFDSLPDEARDELREEGFDARSFWERLKKSGPTDILTVEGDDGTRIQVWIE
jgi:tetratricopeptide (TPR) repeat protein